MGSKIAAPVRIGLCVLIAAMVQPSLADEDRDARLRRLESMSALDKDRLRVNLERFSSLPAEQQKRVRELEEQLSQDPRGEELRGVMVRYHEWLRALPSAERAAIHSLPEPERLAKIRAMLQTYEAERLRELAKESLTPADVDQVRAWVTELIQERKQELLRQFPLHVREKLAQTDDPRYLAMVYINYLRDRDRDRSKPPSLVTELQITEQDRERLLAKLSEQAREVYRQAGTDDEMKQTIFHLWFYIAFRPRPPTPEDLQAFMSRLPPEEQDRLENLPPEQLRAELMRKFYFDRGRRWDKEMRSRNEPPHPGRPPRDPRAD